MKIKTISIIGTVGVPAKYGGFETLVDNLAVYHKRHLLPEKLVIYCSKAAYQDHPKCYLSSELHYIKLNANGIQSVIYDIISILLSAFRNSNEILVLGISGAIVIPLIRLLFSSRITTNIDGLEWRREKWGRLAKYFLRISEKIAIKFSHKVIADNDAIAEYVEQVYGKKPMVIAYGGDHAVFAGVSTAILPEHYSTYSISVCRIEPENNVHLILDAFARIESKNIIIIGNWNKSDYGQSLLREYGANKNINLLDPIYDLYKLNILRKKADYYIHGHSAGGTNPSLVEAMHFGRPVLAFDCSFNRYTTEDKAFYFSSCESLITILNEAKKDALEKCGKDLLEVAKRRYTWEIIAAQYFQLLVS